MPEVTLICSASFEGDVSVFESEQAAEIYKYVRMNVYGDPEPEIQTITLEFNEAGEIISGTINKTIYNSPVPSMRGG